MPRRIEKCKSPVLKIEHKFGTLDSFSLSPLVGVDICDICQLPCLHVFLFGLLFISGELLLIDKL